MCYLNLNIWQSIIMSLRNRYFYNLPRARYAKYIFDNNGLNENPLAVVPNTAHSLYLSDIKRLTRAKARNFTASGY